jgi:hypothetical protein
MPNKAGMVSLPLGKSETDPMGRKKTQSINETEKKLNNMPLYRQYVLCAILQESERGSLLRCKCFAVAQPFGSTIICINNSETWKFNNCSNLRMSWESLSLL